MANETVQRLIWTLAVDKILKRMGGTTVRTVLESEAIVREKAHQARMRIVMFAFRSLTEFKINDSKSCGHLDHACCNGGNCGCPAHRYRRMTQGTSSQRTGR